MKRLLGLVYFCTFSLFFSCSEKESIKSTENEKKDISSKDVMRFSAGITELSDEEYPDNPDLGSMSSNYHSISHDSVVLLRKENGNFQFIITPGNANSDSIVFDDININVYMPSVPDWIKSDEFLTNFGYTNAEWNRHQIRFDRDQEYFSVKGKNYENTNLNRVDIARNCLNSGLWELIFYSEEDGKKVNCYHGWFMFPENLYSELFETVNGEKFTKYKPRIADWIDPENELVNFDLLRRVKSEKEIEFVSLNDQMYPMTGARKSKRKNIIYPKEINTINDLLNDSTRFATFSPPGLYTRSDPRRTWLSRLSVPKKIVVKETRQDNLDNENDLVELEVEYTNKNGSITTFLVLGGFSWDQIPTLTTAENNNGFKMPMGIGNHPFYENYKKALNNPVKKNPYYGLLLDHNKKCLDSHAIGIDGPLMFWDAEDEGLLHILIMAFERHAFVGHYTIRPNSK